MMHSALVLFLDSHLHFLPPLPSRVYAVPSFHSPSPFPARLSSRYRASPIHYSFPSHLPFQCPSSRVSRHTASLLLILKKWAGTPGTSNIWLRGGTFAFNFRHACFDSARRPTHIVYYVRKSLTSDFTLLRAAVLFRQFSI
ncbi:hypothetical protein C8J57DRAFT_1367493 [Mycena rebaudengoi]|nr:hypothetical protein C8J57DRAFT_1367493 [Mycena rebaudengoi]